MPTGIVKWYNPDKGFGFIARDDGGDDLFVHRSALDYGSQGGLSEGDKVSFDVGFGAKGANATNVSVTEKSDLPPRPKRFNSDDRHWSNRVTIVEDLPLATGIVRRYDAEKGFGFIRRDSGDDVFVHRSALAGGELGEGDQVEFRVGTGPKGPRAEQVRVVQAATSPHRF